MIVFDPDTAVNATITNGGLTFSTTSYGTTSYVIASAGISDNSVLGKVYFETVVATEFVNFVSHIKIGLIDYQLNAFFFTYRTQRINYSPNGQIVANVNGIVDGSLARYEDSVVGIAIDRYNKQLWVSVNGVWQVKTPGIDAGYDYSSYILDETTEALAYFEMYLQTGSLSARFRAEHFTYPIPDGFLPYENYPGSVSGNVYEKTNGLWIPGPYPVRVYERDTGILVGSTISAADGSYTVTNLDPSKEHYVMALDNSVPIQRSAVQDKVIPT